MNIYTKEELISKIKEIAQLGWHKSIKKTIDKRNDGAVGNTLEYLLNIEENNLPLPNTNEWELKGQRENSKSLVTLKHIEPSPRAVNFVSKILLPKYGWLHKEAGKKYPKYEMSFRSTTYSKDYTIRGFKLLIDKKEEKIKFIFNSNKVSSKDSKFKSWLKKVESKAGLGNINPIPYWGFNDLRNSLGVKLMNCFYVIAESKMENKHEYFKYKKLLVLSNFSFDKLLECFDNGYAYIDFVARTGHNHGTKFRIKQQAIPSLYNHVNVIFLQN